MAGRSDLARELLGLARDDRVAAEAMLEIGTISDSIVGFHAQQAVEKALKAALAARALEFPFTHDLAVLVDLCCATEPPTPRRRARRSCPAAAA